MQILLTSFAWDQTRKMLRTCILPSLNLPTEFTCSSSTFTNPKETARKITKKRTEAPTPAKLRVYKTSSDFIIAFWLEDELK